MGLYSVYINQDFRFVSNLLLYYTNRLSNCKITTAKMMETFIAFIFNLI